MNQQLEPRVKAIFNEIVAHAPTPGPTPVGEPMQLERPGPTRRPWLAAAAAAVMLVGVGGLFALSTRSGSVGSGTDRAASSSSPALSDTVDTVPLLDANWEEAVVEVLDQMGWPVTRLEHVPGTADPYADSVVAFVGEGRIVFDVRALSDGEYSDDVAWQMAAAGSNSPGTPVVGGTLFVTDDAAVADRSAVVVSPAAVVTVRSESELKDELADIDAFATVATQLVHWIPNVLEAAGS